MECKEILRHGFSGNHRKVIFKNICNCGTIGNQHYSSAYEKKAYFIIIIIICT